MIDESNSASSSLKRLGELSARKSLSENEEVEKAILSLAPAFEGMQKAVSEAVEKLVEIGIAVTTSMIEAITETLKSPIVKELSFQCAMIADFPNKRIVHLALYHPKERVRKKNINRIIKTLKLEEKRKKR